MINLKATVRVKGIELGFMAWSEALRKRETMIKFYQRKIKIGKKNALFDSN